MISDNRPEWLISQGISPDGAQRRYLIHLAMPRFTTRIVRIYPDKRPFEEEGKIELKNQIGCYVSRYGNRVLLCETDWIDDVPDEKRGQWLLSAADALNAIDDQQHFLWWKALRPVKDMASRIKLDISRCQRWSDYTEAFGEEDDRTDGALMKRVRSAMGVFSTGEVPVLLSMLHAADYSRVADEIAGNDNWRRLDRTYGDHAEATAFAIMRQ